MELHEANRIVRSVKSALLADGIKLPPSAESDGLLMLLGKLDCDKYLAPKIKHARTLAQDSAAFIRAFCTIAFFRALEALRIGLPDPVTSASLMMLHKTVCGDLDDEAGKPRTAEYSADGCEHTDPKYIQGSLRSVIAKMNGIERSPAVGKEDFAGYITHYMRELVIMRPFERGSDFTVRLFITAFCKARGFSLCYYRTPATEIRAAETAAFRYDDVTPMYKLFMKCISYEHTTAEPQKSAPQTRRALNKPRGEKRTAPQSSEMSEIKAAAQNGKKDNDGDKPVDVLKRAIKLQQKITKLNEQLTELMTASGSKPPARKAEKPGRQKPARQPRQAKPKTKTPDRKTEDDRCGDNSKPQ